MNSDTSRSMMTELISYFAHEQGLTVPGTEGALEEQLWVVLRALMNTRPAGLPPERIVAVQDQLLQHIIAERGVATVDDTALVPGYPALRLWRGDITTLAVDAIVNAANSQMTGCWAAGHECIDNAIHTFAGVQLRNYCAQLMAAQGELESTGRAKLTPAFNLPAEYVIHTVGPIAQGNPTPIHAEQLARCYVSCLDAARAAGVQTLALCGISTGVFGYPARAAARIAVTTVKRWLAQHDTSLTVIFNVFSEHDEAIYRELLGCPA